MFKKVQFLLKMQSSKYAYSAVSKHNLSLSPDLSNLIELLKKATILYLSIFQVRKKKYKKKCLHKFFVVPLVFGEFVVVALHSVDLKQM